MHRIFAYLVGYLAAAFFAVSARVVEACSMAMIRWMLGIKSGNGRGKGRFGAVLLFSVVALAGCSAGDRGLDLVYLPDVAQPVPVSDLPEEMRIKNWVGTDVDGSRGGSCVHASTIHCFRAAGRYDLEAKWFAMRDKGYEGPEADFRILQKLDEQGVPFLATDGECERDDIDVLQAASDTGRWAVIFYYPSHSINFVEFADVNGVENAILLDNNFPERYIAVPRDVFERSWLAYGGFAVVPWIEPVVPRTFARAVPREYVTAEQVWK